MNWELCKAVDRNPNKLGGKWCFAGTRMPVVSLFEHLDQGATLEEFFEWFPDVPPELVHEGGSCKIRFCGPFGNRSLTLTARKVNRINTSLQSRDR